MSNRPAPTWRQLRRRVRDVVGSRAETGWLMEAASGMDRTALLAALDTPAGTDGEARLAGLLERRRRGEPLQHVLGHWGFRTLEVSVDSRVLVPRPETEQVVEVALSELDRRARPDALVADLGTGSGVIALSIVAEREGPRVVATDDDAGALQVATANRARLPGPAAARLEVRRGDWYGALPPACAGRFDLIVSNPPYVSEGEWPLLAETVRAYDPYRALVAGPSGLEAIEAILAGAGAWLASDGSVVLEIAPGQAGAVRALARANGFGEVALSDDLAGRARVLRARR